jgi:hypothetical protein
MYGGLNRTLYNHFFQPVTINSIGVLHWLYANLYEANLHTFVTIVAGGSENYPRMVRATPRRSRT